MALGLSNLMSEGINLKILLSEAVLTPGIGRRLFRGTLEFYFIYKTNLNITIICISTGQLRSLRLFICGFYDNRMPITYSFSEKRDFQLLS